MNLTSSGGRHSRGSYSAVGASAAARWPLVAGAVASPGTQVLQLVRQVVHTGHSERHVSCTRSTRAIVVSSATARARNQLLKVTTKDRASKNISSFQPCIWGDFFLAHSSPLATSAHQQASMVHRAEQLKEQVAKLIATSSTCSLYQRIHLIDVLERLCLNHLFEEEINDVLNQINTVDVSGCDLQTVAMWFYLLRKHGYRVSPDVFAEFREEQGTFTANNPRDLLSLYNAASLRIHGEIILDEAISFTKKCLESIMPWMEASLASEIKCALEIPLPRSVRIYDAKSHMPEYENEAEANELIMELAKLNYNLVQLQYQEELKIITSWDPALATGLPQNMRSIFGKLLDTCQSIEDELSPEEKYRMPYLKNFIVDLVRPYNKEVQWREQGYVPSTVEEHLQVSARSGACHLLSCTSFVGMGDVATEESFERVHSVPKIVQALCIILRLSDDLKSYEREEKMTSHVASTTESCMKEHKVPVQEARVLIEDMIDETWKIFNEEWLNMKNHQPKEILERIFNLTRTMVYMYKQDDAYTNCHVIKDTIKSLFVEPVSIM